jgi:putative sterol carrier protein
MPSVFSMMKTLCSFANRNDDISGFLEGLESKVVMDVKGEEPFYIEFSGGKLSVNKGIPPGYDATIKSDKSTMDDIIAGRLTQEDAFNRKLIETSGSIQDAMRVRFVINRTLQQSRTLGAFQKLLGTFG